MNKSYRVYRLKHKKTGQYLDYYDDMAYWVDNGGKTYPHPDSLKLIHIDINKILNYYLEYLEEVKTRTVIQEDLIGDLSEVIESCLDLLDNGIMVQIEITEREL